MIIKILSIIFEMQFSIVQIECRYQCLWPNVSSIIYVLHLDSQKINLYSQLQKNIIQIGNI